MIGVRLPAEAWEEADEDVEGLLEEWLVAEGEAVAAGQSLASAIILKTSFDVTAPAAGTISSIAVAAGETFGRDRDLALIAGAEEPAPAGVGDGNPDPVATEAATATPGSSSPATEAAAAAPGSSSSTAAATPGSSSEAATATPGSSSEATGEGESIPFLGVRGAVARNLTAAWKNPRVAAGVVVDMRAALALQSSLAEDLGPETKLTPTHLLLRAVALTLREHPRLNGVVGEEGVELSSRISLGFAVSLEEGIVVPVIEAADDLSLAEIAAETRRLAGAARAGELGTGEQSGGTFSVSTLGATGIDWFTPVLNSPQIAILGVGAIAERAIAAEGEVIAAPTMELTLVYDHRAIDGEPASRMLEALRRRLESGDLRS